MNCKTRRNFFIAIVLFFVAAIGLPAAKAQVIDLGNFGGHEYFYGTGSYFSFASANLAAQTLVDGQLVSITSAAEENFLISTIAPLAPNELYAAWIGLTRPTSADPYMWVSGESVVYSNWRPPGVGQSFGEPTNGPGETNGVMYINDPFDPGGIGPVPVGYWADSFSTSGQAFNAIFEVVPEPSTWVYSTLAGALLIVVESCRFKRRRRLAHNRAN